MDGINISKKKKKNQRKEERKVLSESKGKYMNEIIHKAKKKKKENPQ